MPEKFESQFFKPGTEKVSEMKEKNIESSELRREGEQIYSKEFESKLDEILNHEFTAKDKDKKGEKIILKDIVDKHLEGFSSPEFPALSVEEKAEKQREFVMDLGRGINKIPGGDPWAFYFDRIMEKGKINCSGSSALLGMTLENTKEKTGIKNVEYGFPYGHAVNMITFGDSRLYFADSRNGMFEDISDYTKSEEKEGLKVYKIEQSRKEPGYQLIYRNIPVSSIEEGVMGSYLSNLHSAYRVSEGKFDDALRMGRSREELKEIQKMAKGVCRDKQLVTPEQSHHLENIKDSYIGNLGKYEQSKEFEREGKRIAKIIEKRKRG